jgi:hypothetical protein
VPWHRPPSEGRALPVSAAPTGGLLGKARLRPSGVKVLRFAADLASRGFALDALLAAALPGPRRPPFGIAEGNTLGLRVSFDGHVVQGTLFSGSESVSLREL